MQTHEAEEAMADPYVTPAPSSDMEDEDRDALIGMTRGGRLLLVVFTLTGDTIRVVTARRPTTHEERLYWRRR